MHSSLTDFSCTPVLMLDRRSLRASEMGGGAGCSLVVVGFEEGAESGGGGGGRGAPENILMQIWSKV